MKTSKQIIIIGIGSGSVVLCIIGLCACVLKANTKSSKPLPSKESQASCDLSQEETEKVPDNYMYYNTIDRIDSPYLNENNHGSFMNQNNYESITNRNLEPHCAYANSEVPIPKNVCSPTNNDGNSNHCTY